MAAHQFAQLRLSVLEQDFQHELAADISQQQQHKAGQRPADCLGPAPAVIIMAEQEGTIDQPTGDGENRFVI